MWLVRIAVGLRRRPMSGTVSAMGAITSRLGNLRGSVGNGSVLIVFSFRLLVGQGGDRQNFSGRTNAFFLACMILEVLRSNRIHRMQSWRSVIIAPPEGSPPCGVLLF